MSLAGQYSLTGPDRMWALLQSMKHIRQNRLDGDLVECGVWRGGNILLMRKFADEHFPSKMVFGYDTFEGMPEPTDIDEDNFGNKAAAMMKSSLKDEGVVNIHAYATLDTVMNNLRLCASLENVKLIKGAVEKTLLDDANLPVAISLLRLDTDWYESTKIELEILYPRLVLGGVLIIDDYGHFRGAQKAVDEFFTDQHIWLHRVDYTCRLMIKA
jgi:O-methyltransferase